MSVIIEYLGNIGLDAVRDRIKDSAMETAARERLYNYLEKQKNVNEVCTREEEIDFEGLAKYIQEELIEDVKLRLFGESEERARARETIIRKAISYAQSKTKLSKKRAQKIVEDSITILQKYYRSKVNSELLFVAAQTEDTVSKKIDAAEQNISTKMAHIEEKVGEANLLSLDKNVALVRAGDLSQVENNIATVLDTISLEHGLKPDYGFAMNEKNKLISIPLTERATIEHPPRFSVSATNIQLGDTDINKIDSEILSKSYRHQLPISMDIVAAKKYLGDVLDPAQSEADELTGSHIIVNPPPFPPAFACSFSINGYVYFDYVLLRTKEILDDGSILVSNKEQENRAFDLVLNYHSYSKVFSISMHACTSNNSELLNYFQFISALNSGGELQIKILGKKVVLAKGQANRTEADGLNEWINLLKMVIRIEELLDCQIEIPNTISKEEYGSVEHLYELLETGQYQGSWTKIDFEFSISDITRQQVSELSDACYMLCYLCPPNIDLFGTIIHLPIKRTIECAQVYDLEKTKRKAEVLDDEDLIKIRYIPGNGNKTGVYYDYISPDENDSSVVYADIDQ